MFPDRKTPLIQRNNYISVMESLPLLLNFVLTIPACSGRQQETVTPEVVAEIREIVLSNRKIKLNALVDIIVILTRRSYHSGIFTN